MYTGDACSTCEQMWEEYARLVKLRLALIEAQRSRAPLTGMPVGTQIQLVAQAQINIRVRIDEHNRIHHTNPPAARLPMARRAATQLF